MPPWVKRFLRGTHPGVLLLAVVVIAATIAQLTLLAAGPEADPDSYAHATVGRKLLRGERALRMHWVWLPLWHWVHSVASRYADSMRTIRELNVLLTSIAPIILVSLLRMKKPKAAWERWVPWLAGCFLAIMPIRVWHGATGQLEPPLLTMLLGACWVWERTRARHQLLGALGTGLLLSFAALLRYEAWLVPIVFALLWWKKRSWSGVLAWLLPILTVAAWCTAHQREMEEWFWFLRHNDGFATAYYNKVGYPWGRTYRWHRALIWYVWDIPRAELGWLFLTGAAGTFWAARRAPRSWLGVQLIVLAFLTLGMVRSQHLGLARHALTIAPLYATLVAAGILLIAQSITKSRWQVALVAAAMCFVLVRRTWPQYRHAVTWFGTTYASHARIAKSLRRHAGPDDWVFCDSSPIDVMANFPSERVSQSWLRKVTEARLRYDCGTCRRVLIACEAQDAVHLRAVTTELDRDGKFVLLSYP